MLTSAALGVNSILCNHFGESRTIRTTIWSFGEAVALNRYNLRQSWGPVQSFMWVVLRMIAAFAVKPLCQTCRGGRYPASSHPSSRSV